MQTLGLILTILSIIGVLGGALVAAIACIKLLRDKDNSLNWLMVGDLMFMAGLGLGLIAQLIIK